MKEELFQWRQNVWKNFNQVQQSVEFTLTHHDSGSSLTVITDSVTTPALFHIQFSSHSFLHFLHNPSLWVKHCPPGFNSEFTKKSEWKKMRNGAGKKSFSSKQSQSFDFVCEAWTQVVSSSSNRFLRRCCLRRVFKKPLGITHTHPSSSLHRLHSVFLSPTLPLAAFSFSSMSSAAEGRFPVFHSEVWCSGWPGGDTRGGGRRGCYWFALSGLPSVLLCPARSIITPLRVTSTWVVPPPPAPGRAHWLLRLRLNTWSAQRLDNCRLDVHATAMLTFVCAKHRLVPPLLVTPAFCVSECVELCERAQKCQAGSDVNETCEIPLLSQQVGSWGTTKAHGRATDCGGSEHDKCPCHRHRCGLCYPAF